MKKIVGIIVIILLIPVIIYVIKDVDRTPIYPTTEFNIEKLTRISSLDIENNDIELFKLPNGVGDRWYPNSVERRVGRILINDNSSFTYNASSIDTTDNLIRYDFNTNLSFAGTSSDNNLTALSNIFIQSPSEFGTDLTSERFWILPPNGGVRIIINYNKLIPYGFILDDTPTYNNAMKLWLSDNNVVIYYQLATPIIETTTTLPEFIDFYEGGSVIVDDGIIDYTVVENQATINYIEGNITTVVDNQFKISKPTKIISKSNDLYDYDLSNLPSYIEYGSLPAGTYGDTLEFINNNQNKEIKIFFDDIIQENKYKIYIENDTIIINNATEIIRIYNNDTYTSTRNLDTNITYKLEGYNIIDYIDGEFDNTVLAFFWVIPILLVGGLFYLLLTKRKE